jgi:hypothetical protein
MHRESAGRHRPGAGAVDEEAGKLDVPQSSISRIFLPSVVRAEYCGGYRIQMAFNDDSEKTIDFRKWLTGPVFEPLKAPNRFRSFFLDGGTVAWPNGAGIAPETLKVE